MNKRVFLAIMSVIAAAFLMSGTPLLHPESVSATDPNISGISAGADHTCARTASFGIECWGFNQNGQVGDGTTVINRLSPVDVVGGTSGFGNVSAGFDFTCGTQAGGAKCWGLNDAGQLGNGTTTNSSTPVDVTGLTSGVAIVSAGGATACAVMTAGGVKCWGQGPLGNGTTASSTTPVDVTGLGAFALSVSVGATQICVATSTGGLKCWGFNSSGEVGNGTNTQQLTPVNVVGLTSGVLAYTTGASHTCAVTATNGVKCWGFNLDGELGDGTTTSRNVPTDVVGLTTGANGVTAGTNHTCARLSGTGGVKCWGRNDQGQLGSGTTTSSLTPVDVTGLSGIATFAAGGAHTCAVVGTGAFCWGDNSFGDIGDCTETQRTTPVAVQVRNCGATTVTMAITSTSAPIGTIAAGPLAGTAGSQMIDLVLGLPEHYVHTSFTNFIVPAGCNFGATATVTQTVTVNSVSQNVSRLVTLVQAGTNSDVISSPAATTSLNLGTTGSVTVGLPAVAEAGEQCASGRGIVVVPGLNGDIILGPGGTTTAPAPGTTVVPPTPLPTIAIPQAALPTPVIPVFQNPNAGGFFNPIAKSPTPRPVVAAAPPTFADPGGCNPPPGTGTAGICLRPPNTGNAGLKALQDGTTD